MLQSFVRRVTLPVLLVSAAFAQTKPAALAFEVASIKPAGPLNPQAIASGQMRIGIKVDQARVDIASFSLSDLIRTAYKIKPYQLTGPDWLMSGGMSAERFNILAKMPEGATEEQMPEMLQALLAERFKLTIHRDSKEHSVYALVVGKGGHKMKESPVDPNAPAGDAPKSTNMMLGGNGGQSMRVTPTGEGGRGGMSMKGGPMGDMKMTMTPGGSMRMEAERMSMAMMSEMLSQFVDRPVVDMTELKGNFQVGLDLSMEELRAVAVKAGMGAMMGGGGRGGDAASPLGNTAEPSGTVFSSIQQLGLKLEPRKAPVEVIVVDRLEKMPTEN